MGSKLLFAAATLLAACGQNAAEAPATNRASPVAAAPVAPLDPALAAWRQDKLRECTSLVLLEVPPGTDIQRLCACAIDRGMAGRTLAQLDHPIPGRPRALLRQCATEMGVSTIG